MSCSYPSINEKQCAGEAITVINDHFKWIDTKTAEIVSFSEKLAESINSLQSIIPVATYLSTSIDGLSSGIARKEAFANALTTFPSTSCCYGKPITLFYPYEVFSKEEYDNKVLDWIERNFDPTDTECSFNEVYVIAFKGYVDEQAPARNNMLVTNYRSVFDVENNNERFIIGRFYRAGFPLLKWNLSPTLSPFGCAEAVKQPTIAEKCIEIEQIPIVYYYKFTSCTIPGLVFFSAQDYSYLLGQGAILDGYPNDIFLVSKAPASNQPLKTDLNVLLVTKAGCGESCYLLTNEYGEQIISASRILEAYAGKTSVELEGFSGVWQVEKTTEGCDCACVVVVSKANVDVYKLTNCCAAFLPCPDVQVKDLPKDIWVFDNTGQNYLQSGKAVELAAYPGVRWNITIERFDNQKITADYQITDIFESCKSLAKPNPKPKNYYKLIGSCLNAFRRDLLSESSALKPYVGKVVNINFDTGNYYRVTEFTSSTTLADTSVDVFDVNLYGNNFPEFESATRVVGGQFVDSTNFESYTVAGAEYYPRPTPAYTNAPVDACIRKFSYWYEADKQIWVKNKVENYSKILANWYEGESWFAFSDGQLFDIASKAFGYSSDQLSAYLSKKNLYIEIYVTFKRYRKVLRPSRDQLYGEETDSIAVITNVKVYDATISTIASFQGLVSCGTVYVLKNICTGIELCVVEGGKTLQAFVGRVIATPSGAFRVSVSSKNNCSFVAYFTGGIIGVLTEEQALLYCITNPPLPPQGEPVPIRNIDCSGDIIYFNDSNNRYYYNPEMSPGELVEGVYAGDPHSGHGLYANYLYKFNNGIPSEIGLNCCSGEKTVYASCCRQDELPIWVHPDSEDLVFENAESCNEYIATGNCTSVGGDYIDPDTPCAKKRAVNCSASIVDPFFCRNQETYYDCDDNGVTLYIDRKDGLYYVSEDAACLCEAPAYSDSGPLGLGGKATVENGGYLFSDGVRDVTEEICTTTTTPSPCGEEVHYTSCEDDASTVTFYYTDDGGGGTAYYNSDYGCAQKDPSYLVTGEYFGPGGTGAGARPSYDFFEGERGGDTGKCTTTTPAPNCCQDNGYEPSPLAEWENDYEEVTVYCLYPIDDYINCYQYVEPTTTTTEEPTTTTTTTEEPTTTTEEPTTNEEPNPPPPVPGCTDPEATNYNSAATVDNGTCTYPVYGCKDSSATNYNPSATVNDGSCTYTILGCTDPSANNFNPAATQDDGSCTYTTTPPP